MAKAKKLSIIELYMHHILEYGEQPSSVYKFCKDNGLTEKQFYQEYASFSVLQKSIFEAFFSNTLELLHKNKEYKEYEAGEKLLSFYYTFIAMLTENRSYVSLALRNEQMNLKHLDQLTRLRKHFIRYVKEINGFSADDEQINLHKLKSTSMAEGTWFQLLMIIKFWLHDESKQFEKTDIFIEKTVKASQDLMDFTPLESVIDLGKFLFKEKMA